MDFENLANIKNPEELQSYIKIKVEEEIRLRGSEIKQEKADLQHQQVEMTQKLAKLQAAEKQLEVKAVEINKRIKGEIEKQEILLNERKKDLDRKYFENEKKLERQFADKEKLLENKEKNLNKQAFEAEKRINAEMQRREREIERKRIVEERKIPNIVKSAQDEVRIQKKVIEDEQKKLDKKISTLRKAEKKLQRRQDDLNRQAGSSDYKDENSFQKQRVKKEEDDSNSWLTTYSDVITLLLTLFVFMLTVAKMDSKKLDEIQHAINIGLLKKSGDELINKGQLKEPVFAAMRKKLQDVFKANKISDQVSLQITDDGVKLELASSALYDLGSATIKKEIEPVLDEIATILLEVDKEDIIIEVEGHTDNIPIKTVQFPSNWELSANRATNIVKFFISKGVNSGKLRASGFADSRPKVPNLDREGNSVPLNQAQNRRVEIYIEKAKK